MKWLIVLFLMLLVITPNTAFAQEVPVEEEVVVVAEPPQYVFEEPSLELPQFPFMNEEYEALEFMSSRDRLFRREETNAQLRRNLLQRLPNMCLIVPISLDGAWAAGCIYHFKPNPVRAYFR